MTRPDSASSSLAAESGLLLTGALSLLLQVLVLREIHVALNGDELGDILSLGAWLAFSALGALCAAVVARRSPPLPLLLGLLLSLSLVAPGMVSLIRAARSLLHAVPGAWLPLDQRVLVALLAVSLPGFLGGALFSASARLAVGGRLSLGRAYGIESLGGLLGGLISTLILALGLGNWQAALLTALLAQMGALILALRSRPRPRALSLMLLLPIASVLLGLPASKVDLAMTRWTHPQAVASRDSPQGRATVTHHEGQSALFMNDTLVRASEAEEAELFVRLAALYHARPERILLLGGAVEGLVPPALALEPTRLDQVEASRAALDLLRPYLPALETEALDSPRLSSFTQDPRAFLRGPQAEEPYQLVILALPEPRSVQGARAYTRDFFALCRARMTEDGVLALRLAAAENLWTPDMRRRVASVVQALGEVFSSVLVLPGAESLLLASPSPLERDPAVLRARLEASSQPPRTLSPAMVEYLSTNDRARSIEQELRETRAITSTDDRPILAWYSFFVGLSLFLPSLALPDTSASMERLTLASFAALGLLLLSLSILAGAGRGKHARSMLAFLAGFLGMALEAVLILRWQVARGSLYQDLGVLLCAFMGGLALGAWGLAASRICSGHRLAVAASSFALLALAVALEARMGLTLGLGARALELLLAGASTGGMIAVAGIDGREDPKGQTLAGLFAWDLLGGALGAALCGLLMLPRLGLGQSASALAILAFALFLGSLGRR